MHLVPQLAVRALLGALPVGRHAAAPSSSTQLSRMMRCTLCSSKPPSSLAKSSGWATPSPCGQSEPKRMRSTPMSSASAARSSSRYGRDPDVAPQRVERVLGEHPRRLVGLLAQPLGEHVQPVGAVLDAGDAQARVPLEHAVDDERRRPCRGSPGRRRAPGRGRRSCRSPKVVVRRPRPAANRPWYPLSPRWNATGTDGLGQAGPDRVVQLVAERAAGAVGPGHRGGADVHDADTALDQRVDLGHGGLGVGERQHRRRDDALPGGRSPSRPRATG